MIEERRQKKILYSVCHQDILLDKNFGGVHLQSSLYNSKWFVFGIYVKINVIYLCPILNFFQKGLFLEHVQIAKSTSSQPEVWITIRL